MAKSKKFGLARALIFELLGKYKKGELTYKEAADSMLLEYSKSLSGKNYKDVVKYNNKSVIFRKIIENTNQTKETIEKEFKARTNLIKKLVGRKEMDFKEINEIFNTFIKNRDALPSDLK